MLAFSPVIPLSVFKFSCSFGSNLHTGSMEINLGLVLQLISHFISQRFGHGTLHMCFTFIASQRTQFTRRFRRCPLWYFPHSYFQHPFISDSSSLKISVPLNISSFCTLHKFMRLEPSSGHMYQENEREKVVVEFHTHSDHRGPFHTVPLANKKGYSLRVSGSSLPARPPYIAGVQLHD